MDEYFVEEKSSMDKLLDFLVFVAVFAVTLFLILEIIGLSGKTGIDTQSVNNIYFYVNFAVFAIFFADLFRLWKQSADYKEFISKNWLDILATIPFELIAFMVTGLNPSTAQALGVAKWIRVTKLSGLAKAQKISRISKISKEFKAASHLRKEGEEYQRKHRL